MHKHDKDLWAHRVALHSSVDAAAPFSPLAALAVALMSSMACSCACMTFLSIPRTQLSICRRPPTQQHRLTAG